MRAGAHATYVDLIAILFNTRYLGKWSQCFGIEPIR